MKFVLAAVSLALALPSVSAQNGAGPFPVPTHNTNCGCTTPTKYYIKVDSANADANDNGNGYSPGGIGYTLPMGTAACFVDGGYGNFGDEYGGLNTGFTYESGTFDPQSNPSGVPIDEIEFALIGNAATECYIPADGHFHKASTNCHEADEPSGTCFDTVTFDTDNDQIPNEGQGISNIQVVVYCCDDDDGGNSGFTDSPTGAPTDAPTGAPTKDDDDGNTGGGGDPHFARWGQERDTFHGECDLSLIHSEAFHNHAGFDLQARTTIASYYSYIESMAFRVGEYTVEVEKGAFHINGEKITKTDLPYTFGEDFKYTISQITDTDTRQNFKVDLNEKSSIVFKFYKHYLTFDLKGKAADFGDSVGLLGDYHDGSMAGRDGRPIIDFTDNAFEWQVNPHEDHVLFREAREPQLPYEKCRMPTAARPARRALRANTALEEEAKTACAHLQGKNFELCIDDVLTTGDIGLAEEW